MATLTVPSMWDTTMTCFSGMTFDLKNANVSQEENRLMRPGEDGTAVHKKRLRKKRARREQDSDTDFRAASSSSSSESETAPDDGPSLPLPLPSTEVMAHAPPAKMLQNRQAIKQKAKANKGKKD